MIDYLRDPGEIYRRSFAAIRAETDLSRLPDELAPLALRIVHACGMPEIVGELKWSDGAPSAGRAALTAGAPILCDATMVAHGIVRRRLPARNAVLCWLGSDEAAARASAERTTLSAAAVADWRPHLAGAIVAIGNAPTALFRLLEELDQGAARPALILGFPVGFIGAAEAKAELARDARDVPFITLLGRRGGSAIAAAAVNALASDAGEDVP
jgi:precorrin-8X/cobalt-precorrin-8 methylmutase